MAEEIDAIDLVTLNALAAGTDKQAPRIVASGIGGKLMGTKDMIATSGEDITKSSTSKLTLAEKDRLEREKYTKTAHISEQPWTLQNWSDHINWLNMILVVFVPVYGITSAFYYPPQLKTFLLGVILYICSGLSITAGYHRLYSHKSYDAATPVRILFAAFGAGAVEGSIKWWSHSHRIHHRYTDTPRDPYDARQGFWYSHMGWMLTKANPRFRARADISDLTSDWVVRVQHKYYLFIMIFMAVILPVLIAGFGWGDWYGGLIYGGILKTCFIQQATFCVNSLAHWIGVQPFDDRRSPRDHAITAVVTFGEGYHNFHHEFPSDYRNALRWYQYDPTKIVIWCMSKVGLAWNLKTFSQNAIEQGLVQQQQKKLDRMKANLSWGVKVDKLPVWTRDEFQSHGKEEGLMIVNGIVHDVKSFVKDHPGGQALMKASLGKDATKAFNGGVYQHSNAANNMLGNMRVAVIKDEANPNVATSEKDKNV